MSVGSNNFLAAKGILLTMLVLALAACTAGNGEGLDSNGQPNPINPPAASDFQQIQDTIFTPICTACHIGAQPNSGGGSVRIEGLPAAYVPGQKYAVRVVASQTGFTKYGFMLAATNSTGEQAGKITANDNAVDLKMSNGVTFAKHSFNGTDAFGASRSWSVVWTAPASGSVKFAVQAVAANGSGNVIGDFAYSTETTVSPAATNAD